MFFVYKHYFLYIFCPDLLIFLQRCTITYTRIHTFVHNPCVYHNEQYTYFDNSSTKINIILSLRMSQLWTAEVSQNGFLLRLMGFICVLLRTIRSVKCLIESLIDWEFYKFLTTSRSVKSLTKSLIENL